MTAIRFSKFHGFGNDYIVIDSASLPVGTSLPALARTICHRHTGAGSDGIAVLTKIDGGGADYACAIVNPDGSIAAFSGNGTRCAAAYLYQKGIWLQPELRLETLSGVKNYHLLESTRGRYEFRAEIGKPRFASAAIPFASETPLDTVIDHEIWFGHDEIIRISAVNVGNPVACIFVEDFDFDWREIGRDLESHAAFPERANIVFVRVIDDANIDLRIWERGAGETAASGTCSSAAAVLAAITNRTGRTVAVHSPGGTANVIWRDDDEIILTGTADHVYDGQFPM